MNVDIINVEWRIEDGQTKGRVTKDSKNRRKIVFINRNFRGRMPQNGEITEAEVYEETFPDPNNRNKGVLKVRPIYAADPNALTEEVARAEMLKLIRANGPIFVDGRIDVNLPGWNGTLRGSIPQQHFEDGPLTALWRFSGDSGNPMSVHDENSYGVVITGAITVTRHEKKVVDWKQALSDLGKPASVEPMGEFAYIHWRDKQGNELRTKLSRQIAERSGYQFGAVGDTPAGYVTVEATLLDGLWVLEDGWVARPEQIDYENGTIKRAAFEDRYDRCLPPQIRQEVIRLLRMRLHSPEWHKQKLIAESLKEENTSTVAMWETIRTLQKLVDDPFTPSWFYDRPVLDVREARDRIRKLSTIIPRFFQPGDPDIYQQESDDGKETQQLSEKNKAELDRIDALVAKLITDKDAVPQKHTDPDLPILAQIELEQMRDILDQKLMVFQNDTSEKAKVLRNRARFVRTDLESAIQILKSTENIEEKLHSFCNARREFERWIEREKEEDKN